MERNWFLRRRIRVWRKQFRRPGPGVAGSRGRQSGPGSGRIQLLALLFWSPGDLAALRRPLSGSRVTSLSRSLSTTIETTIGRSVDDDGDDDGSRLGAFAASSVIVARNRRPIVMAERSSSLVFKEETKTSSPGRVFHIPRAVGVLPKAGGSASLSADGGTRGRGSARPPLRPALHVASRALRQWHFRL
jgi:hypothetical protein